nr:immunoglobulin light chain junction region [Macaca mulatta]
CQQHNTYPVTF